MLTGIHLGFFLEISSSEGIGLILSSQQMVSELKKGIKLILRSQQMVSELKNKGERCCFGRPHKQ